MPEKTNLQKLTIPRTKGIELCTDLLAKGNSRQSIVQELTTTYKVSEGGVDKWIKAARPLALVRQKEAETIRVTQMEASIAEAVKSGLLSDIEIEMMLCKIISGDMQVEEWIKGDIVLRNVTPMEVIQAAKAIYQKRGSNAPTKIAATTKDGEDIEPVKITLKLG
jgi:hypothetical protein